MRLLLTLFCLTAISVSFMHMPETTTAAPPEYDIIIRNGRVVDGSGRPGYKADVAIKNDRIALIGNLRGAKAKRDMDAQGQVVAPGFIDMLGQSEQYVLNRSARDEQSHDGRDD
jgi:dihydroorotase/N-acyl-D-amino-acid deacylase